MSSIWRKKLFVWNRGLLFWSKQVPPNNRTTTWGTIQASAFSQEEQFVKSEFWTQQPTCLPWELQVRMAVTPKSTELYSSERQRSQTTPLSGPSRSILFKVKSFIEDELSKVDANDESLRHLAFKAAFDKVQNWMMSNLKLNIAWRLRVLKFHLNATKHRSFSTRLISICVTHCWWVHIKVHSNGVDLI